MGIVYCFSGPLGKKCLEPIELSSINKVIGNVKLSFLIFIATDGRSLNKRAEFDITFEFPNANTDNPYCT